MSHVIFQVYSKYYKITKPSQEVSRTLKSLQACQCLLNWLHDFSSQTSFKSPAFTISWRGKKILTQKILRPGDPNLEPQLELSFPWLTMFDPMGLDQL